MAVIKATEKLDGARSSRTFDGDEYTREFVVVTDDKSDTADTVRDATTIPRRGDKYPGDKDAWCHVIDPAQRTQSPTVWDVRVEYTTNPGAVELFADPIKKAPELSWSSRDEMHDFAVDQDGVAVMNTAHTPFDPTPQIPFKIPILTFTRNEKRYDTEQMRVFANAVNSETFLGCEPFQVMCTRIAGEFVRWAYTAYWRVTYEFQFKLIKWGWEQPFLNVGLAEETGEEPVSDDYPDGKYTKKAITEEYEKFSKESDGRARASTPSKKINVPTRTWVPLNLQGKPMGPNSNWGVNGPYYLHFRRYPHERFQRLAGGHIESMIRVALSGRVPVPTGGGMIEGTRGG